MSKGKVPSIVLGFAAFLVILLIVLGLVSLFGGGAFDKLKCAIGLFQFAGCPG